MRFGVNAKEHRFETVTLFGHPMLFTTSHIDHSTIPRGVHLYAVRHHSEDREKPIQICAWALANRYGSLLTTTSWPIPNMITALRTLTRKKTGSKTGIP